MTLRWLVLQHPRLTDHPSRHLGHVWAEDYAAALAKAHAHWGDLTLSVISALAWDAMTPRARTIALGTFRVTTPRKGRRIL